MKFLLYCCADENCAATTTLVGIAISQSRMPRTRAILWGASICHKIDHEQPHTNNKTHNKFFHKIFVLVIAPTGIEIKLNLFFFCKIFRHKYFAFFQK